MSKYPTIQLLTETMSWSVEDDEAVLEYIETHCGPFLQQCNDQPLFRGMQRGLNAAAKIKSVRADRLPRDTSQTGQDRMVFAMKQMKLTAHRGNSVFVTGDPGMACEYGDVYAVFPIGNFHYSWSEYMPDAVDGMENAAFTNPRGWMCERYRWILQKRTSTPSSRPSMVLDHRIAEVFDHNAELQKQIKKYTSDDVWKESVDRIWSNPQKREHHEDVLYSYDMLINLPQADRESEVFHIMHVMAQYGFVEENELLYDIYRPTPAEAGAMIAAMTDCADGVMIESKIWRGDDGSLPEAIDSGHEIMINCPTYIALTHYMYEQVSHKLGLKSWQEVRAAHRNK